MLFINVLISLLIVVWAKLFFYFNIWDVRTKYNLVLNRHSKLNTEPINDMLFKMLVLAEDRKYFYHIGIDIFGIIRAVYYNFRGDFQGGSTITQQYIRELTCYKEMSLKRKIVEIFLALLLNDKLNKITVAQNYLNIAYFGHDMIGLDNVRSNLAKYIYSDLLLAAEIITRLKYPQNKNGDLENAYKIMCRKNYLVELYTQKRKLSNSFYWKRKSYYPHKFQSEKSTLFI